MGRGSSQIAESESASGNVGKNWREDRPARRDEHLFDERPAGP